MTLLERIAAFLSERDVPHAVIGAAALAVHGVSRSTLDQDLLVLDRRLLEREFWRSLDPHISVDVRRGNAEDPLAGVVRLEQAGERNVDIVVGRHAWQQDVLHRAARIADRTLRVVDAADLILLKLYAGGIQDRWDIQQLLALDTSGSMTRTVDSRVAALPSRSREIWSTLRTQT